MNLLCCCVICRALKRKHPKYFERKKAKEALQDLEKGKSRSVNLRSLIHNATKPKIVEGEVETADPLLETDIDLYSAPIAPRRITSVPSTTHCSWELIRDLSVPQCYLKGRCGDDVYFFDTKTHEVKDTEGAVCLDIKRPRRQLVEEMVAIYNTLKEPEVERKPGGTFIVNTPFKWNNEQKVWVHVRTGIIQYGIRPYM